MNMLSYEEWWKNKKHTSKTVCVRGWRGGRGVLVLTLANSNLCKQGAYLISYNDVMSYVFTVSYCVFTISYWVFTISYCVFTISYSA